MRKHLAAFVLAIALPATAMAADLPPRPAPMMPVAAPVYNWTGFYIGGNIGGAWRGNDGWTDSLLGLAWNNNNSGVFIGGGQVGVNYQFNNFVLGVEWDADWAANNSNTSVGVIVPGVGTVSITGNDRWISTLAARFGVAFDRWLVYGKAGGAWVGNNGFTISAPAGTVVAGTSNTNTGWMLGVGAEWAFAPSWSAKLEYDYVGLRSRSFVIPGGSPFLAGDVFTTGNRNVSMVKLGVNYLFNWGSPGGVVARY
jgi:outer membrane immunogenic protein